MISILGTIAFGILIYALFWLDRDDVRISNAIWVSYAWLFISCSRPVSAWITLNNVPGNTNDTYIDGSPLDRNILMLLLFLALVVLSRRKQQVQTILRANPQLLIYFGFCLLSLLWSDYPFVVLKRWIRSVGDVAVILVIITEHNWLAALQRVLTRLAFLLVPLSIIFIRFIPSLGRAYSRGGAPEWTGVGTDKNALGMICMLFGVSLLWRGIATYNGHDDKYRKRKLLASGIVFAMILYLLFVVDSQTALSCFGMASILIIVTARSPAFRRPALASTMVGSMITVCFCMLFLGIGGGALSTIGRNASLTGRTQVWQTVLPYATNAWVGAGYENFWIGERVKLFNALLGGLNQAHNGYIEIYLNLGWVGLALLGAVIFAGYRNIMNGLRSSPEASRLKLAFFLICLIYNFTEASFKMMSPVWLMFLWAVIAAPRPRLRRRVRTSALERPHPFELDRSDTAFSPVISMCTTTTI
jgi:exopolysaccharide production protein ExoQ